MTSVRQVLESPEEGRSRRIKAKQQWLQLKNVCEQYYKMKNKKEYVKLVVSVM